MPDHQPPWDPVIYGPVVWRSKKRPSLPLTPTYIEKIEQLKFDVFFAGAKASRNWEDEWPLMTEQEFDQALSKVANLELGGQYPNGTHPRAE